jgi:1,4-dihydroxy-2-naphthoyl-CoA hydrolase
MNTNRGEHVTPEARHAELTATHTPGESQAAEAQAPGAPRAAGKPVPEGPTPGELWKITLGELDEKMGVKILEESVERVVATMPVEGNRQSFGLLHGGASLAVGEAVGSWGKTAVGVDVSATHHRSTRSGLITITATPIHLGSTLTTHEVLITNDAGQRLCTLRITNLLLAPRA